MTIEPIYGDVARRLREARTRRGLTQAELAERAGMTRTALVTIERGKQRLAVHHLVALANALEMEPAMLLPRSGDLGERVEQAVQEAGFPTEVVVWAAEAAETLEQHEDGDETS